MSRPISIGVIALAFVLAGCGAVGGPPLPAQPPRVGVAPVLPPSPPPVASQKVYVGNCKGASITEYPALATGNVAPTATIAGSNTLLSCPEGLAFDNAGVMYVADWGAKAVLEFAPGASGNVAPIRTITGFTGPVGVAIDSAGNVTVSDYFQTLVKVFAQGATGAAAPIRTIDVSAAGLAHADSVQYDSDGELWVSDESMPPNSKIVAYAPGASGPATPVDTISGSNTQLDGPLGTMTDTKNNVWVVNDGSNTLTTYPDDATGNVTPSAVVSGANTLLSQPYGIANDSANSAYVSNFGNDTITVFPSTANGNVAPARAISGSNTGLQGPWAIEVH